MATASGCAAAGAAGAGAVDAAGSKAASGFAAACIMTGGMTFAFAAMVRNTMGFTLISAREEHHLTWRTACQCCGKQNARYMWTVGCSQAGSFRMWRWLLLMRAQTISCRNELAMSETA